MRVKEQNEDGYSRPTVVIVNDVGDTVGWHQVVINRPLHDGTKNQFKTLRGFKAP